MRANPAPPVLVELFTSEGCSSCPPADVLLQRLADAQTTDGSQVIALGEHVDYWDHQGWKDRFASPALTERQRVYASRFRTESIYTPQMVVDGRAEFVGSDAPAVRPTLLLVVLTTIGEATGPSASARVDVTLAPEWRREHLKTAAFVQERRGRAILAAAAMPLAGAR